MYKKINVHVGPTPVGKATKIAIVLSSHAVHTVDSVTHCAHHNIVNCGIIFIPMVAISSNYYIVFTYKANITKFTDF